MAFNSKRIVASLAAVAAMGMALTGCGGDTANGGSGGSDGDVIELTYLHRLPDSDGMVLVNDIVARWNEEHPNIHVTATKFDGSAADMIKKLETDVKANNAPDVAQIGYSELPEVFIKGMVEDVTDEAAKYEDHFAAGPFSLMQVDGKTYGLPQDTGPVVYFYNAAEFEKLGISVPETKEQLIEYSKKAAESGKYITLYQADADLLSALAGASGPWYTVEDGKWVVNTETEGSKEVADTWQQLLDANATSTVARYDPAFDKSVQDGTLIGTVGAAWEAPLIMDSAGDTGVGDWRVAQLGDWFGNGDKTGPDGGSGVAVMKGCEHKAEAVEFLDWFNTQVADLTSQGLVVAATTEAAETPESWSEFYGGQDVMAEFATANANMGEFTYMPGFSTVNAAFKEAADKAIDGEGTVADAFSVAQKTSIDTLKNYNLPVKE